MTAETFTATVTIATVDNHPLTIGEARQLDRLSYIDYRPAVITPLGRIRTGTTTEYVESLPHRPETIDPNRHHSLVGSEDPVTILWWERRTATPWLEVLGHDNSGVLAVYVVASKRAMTEWLDPEDIATVEAWTALPLILLRTR